MTFGEAMARIRRNGKVAVALGDMTVGWRFGREVVLTGPGHEFIDYTPTLDDMRSTEWREVEAR